MTDIVALKGGFFTAANATTGILQHDLLCDGSEANLLECTPYTRGTRDCPADHSEDAGVKCNGMEGGREEKTEGGREGELINGWIVWWLLKILNLENIGEM